MVFVLTAKVEVVGEVVVVVAGVVAVTVLGAAVLHYQP